MPEDPAHWMSLALEEARAAAELGEVPVGAVVVRDGTAIGRAHNRTQELGDPTAHAEVLALRQAASAVGDWRLTDCDVYVTLEPCAMCGGAMVLGRVRRLVFAASDPKAGMCGSLGNLVQDERLNHRIDVVRGVLEEEAATLLEEFFRERR